MLVTCPHTAWHMISAQSMEAVIVTWIAEVAQGIQEEQSTQRQRTQVEKTVLLQSVLSSESLGDSMGI